MEARRELLPTQSTRRAGRFCGPVATLAVQAAPSPRVLDVCYAEQLFARARAELPRDKTKQVLRVSHVNLEPHSPCGLSLPGDHPERPGGLAVAGPREAGCRVRAHRLRGTILICRVRYLAAPSSAEAKPSVQRVRAPDAERPADDPRLPARSAAPRSSTASRVGQPQPLTAQSGSRA